MGSLLIAHSLAPSDVRAEPVLVSVEGQAALAVTSPQSDWFGPGGALAVAAHYPLAPSVLLGARLRAGLLTEGDAPQLPGVRDPGWGSFQLLSIMLRLRPFAHADDARLGTGLFIDLGAGAGFTGKELRPSLEGGLGFGFALGALCLAPTVRYLQVVQPANPPSDDDARLLLAGFELTFNDARPQPKVEPPKVVQTEMPDRDQDGIDDAADSCPDAPEDRDGFEDDDGCPDPDNDKDNIEDAKDKCPNQAEDVDGFEDADGCPDPDNDMDGIADAFDRCPLQAEVINGVDDLDGCPDEGQIVFKNDRIVLEERVLFDFEFARVRRRADPILEAIVNLYKQHPEWGLIQIEGHCDERGPDKLNKNLSERRARNVMRKLVEWGIPAEVMSYAGFGETRPIDLGTTDEAYQRNRRVEFVVLTRVPVKPGTQEAQGSPQPPAAQAQPKVDPAHVPLKVSPLQPQAAPMGAEPAPATQAGGHR
ncbi:MAG TPA: OmpA family protein [Polyangiales bacterium]|nr:OmpA family protein [Polyangiales bacterium]